MRSLARHGPLVALLALATSCRAQPTTATTSSVGPPTLSATTVPAADADVDAMLDRLHDVGASLKTLRADVALTTNDVGSGANSTRRGTILIERRGEGDTRARVDFATVDRDQKRFAEHVEYLLDGDTVIDRVYRKPGAPASVKDRETRRQIRAPGAKTDLLKLGAGPFPLPIGQTKEAVRRQFDVALAPADDAHVGLAGLTLAPLAGTPLADRFHSIVVWLRPGESMPGVIETFNKDESEQKTTTLTNVVLNAPAADADFALTPTDDSWTIVNEPYRGAR